MKRENKKKLKKAGYIAGGTILGAAAGILIYVFGHKPDEVANPCFRTLHRADGTPKCTFDKAWEANWQSVKQLILHGELCNSYKANGKYLTGHSRNALFRNINFLK